MPAAASPDAPAILVANPTAQSGRAAARIARARTLLDAGGIAHSFLPTQPERGTTSAVRRAVDDTSCRLVIAMGGDGTFAEVAKGILGSARATEVALGMLPMGTANDQAKSFGLRAGEDALPGNIAVLVRGATIQVDAGRLARLLPDDRELASDLFFDSMSMGLGAEVLAHRNRDRDLVAGIPFLRSIYRDNLVYAGALVRQLARSPAGLATFDLEAVVDGEVHTYHSVLDVIIKNTAVYGGEWVLCQDATATDGLFEMVPVTGLTDLTTRALSTLRQSPIGELELSRLGIETARPVVGRRFHLTARHPGSDRPPATQIDGEELPPGDRFLIEVLARVLRLVVPETACNPS